MVILYKNLCKNVTLRGHVFFFYIKYSTISTNVYCTLKIEEILNLTNFVPFSFFAITKYLGDMF